MGLCWNLLRTRLAKTSLKTVSHCPSVSKASLLKSDWKNPLILISKFIFSQIIKCTRHSLKIGDTMHRLWQSVPSVHLDAPDTGWLLSTFDLAGVSILYRFAILCHIQPVTCCSCLGLHLLYSELETSVFWWNFLFFDESLIQQNCWFVSWPLLKPVAKTFEVLFHDRPTYIDRVWLNHQT